MMTDLFGSRRTAGKPKKPKPTGKPHVGSTTKSDKSKGNKRKGGGSKKK